MPRKSNKKTTEPLQKEEYLPEEEEVSTPVSNEENIPTPQPTKAKRVMTQEHLDKLAEARKKALEVRRKNKELRDLEKKAQKKSQDDIKEQRKKELQQVLREPEVEEPELQEEEAPEAEDDGGLTSRREVQHEPKHEPKHEPEPTPQLKRTKSMKHLDLTLRSKVQHLQKEEEAPSTRLPLASQPNYNFFEEVGGYMVQRNYKPRGRR